MSILDLLRMGSPDRTRQGTRASAGPHNTAPFRDLIRKEMCRSDRIGMGCTLAAFDLQPGEGRQPKLTHYLARVLAERSRITDEVGFLDDGMVAALLPHTPPDGAWKFALDVCHEVEAKMPRPACTIYCYPSGPETPEQSVGENEPRIRPLESLLLRCLPPWKRAMDVLAASAGLLISAPVLVAAAAAIRLSSPGPVFYSQQRTGLGGRPFTIHKLRTMVIDADARQATLRDQSEQDGPAFKLRNDPRVTTVGRLLRSTSIDELPQLWNVLKGEMSLVGPRPLPCREAEACRRWHRHRQDVTPGLTCIWQVRGRSRVSFEEWMRMDLRYIRLQGFLNDLAILMQTIPAVLLRRGAC